MTPENYRIMVSRLARAQSEINRLKRENEELKAKLERKSFWKRTLLTIRGIPSMVRINRNH